MKSLAIAVVVFALLAQSAEAFPGGLALRGAKAGVGKVLKVASRPFRRG